MYVYIYIYIYIHIHIYIYIYISYYTVDIMAPDQAGLHSTAMKRQLCGFGWLN